jgi:hypothetical protein
MRPEELFNLIKKTKFEKVGDDVDFAVLAFPEEKTVRLIFEESASNRDWQNNFNFPIKPYKNQQNTLWFARGWARAYKSANDLIMEKLIEAQTNNPDYKVEICGWSYGGAISLLAAEDFYFRTKTKADVITFGAPKPLFGRKTKNYVLSCCENVQQFAHRCDVVTLCVPFPGYKMLNKIKVGKWNLFNFFKPNIYHCCYGDKDLYLKS